MSILLPLASLFSCYGVSYSYREGSQLDAPDSLFLEELVLSFFILLRPRTIFPSALISSKSSLILYEEMLASRGRFSTKSICTSGRCSSRLASSSSSLSLQLLDPPSLPSKADSPYLPPSKGDILLVCSYSESHSSTMSYN